MDKRRALVHLGNTYTKCISNLTKFHLQYICPIDGPASESWDKCYLVASICLRGAMGSHISWFEWSGVSQQTPIILDIRNKGYEGDEGSTVQSIRSSLKGLSPVNSVNKITCVVDLHPSCQGQFNCPEEGQENRLVNTKREATVSDYICCPNFVYFKRIWLMGTQSTNGFLKFQE
jgi:hypothetical protein